MFKEIKLHELNENVVDLLNNQWGLVTAGDAQQCNPMTVSWGAVGELWNMDMVTIYIRPQRYTVRFLEEQDYFTLSFYPKDYKEALALCGSKSGRNIDKVEATGLTPVFDEKAPYFEEAKIVLVCRKVAKGAFEPTQFIDNDVMKNYPENDFHYIYYGAVEKVLIKA